MNEKIKMTTIILLSSLFFSTYAQTSLPSSCANLDFSYGDFTNWVGHTSVYPPNTPGTNITVPYYYNTGIVPGRHTIISASVPDPYTCNNVLTLPANTPFCARLGNGGIGAWGDGVQWQRDYLSYTMVVSPSNSLLTYKYAVVLQDPNKDTSNPPHPAPIRPRFGVSILDGSGKLIDPICGLYNVVVDSTVSGFRECPLGDLTNAGGNPANPSGTVYRAWTAVGVDLRKFIGQSVTLQFETWDCGLGGHFGYAYITARCDAFTIQTQICTGDGSVLLMAPEGFSYKWFPGGETTKDIKVYHANPGDSVYVELTTLNGCKTSVGTKVYPTVTVANFKANPAVACLKNAVSFIDSSFSHYTGNNLNVPIASWNWRFGDGAVSTLQNPTHTYNTIGTFTINLTITNQNGCTDSIKKTVEVFPGPIADFVTNDICVNGMAGFTDKSTVALPQKITHWVWTFKDDNSTSILQNNVHPYNIPGTYTVNLFVKTDMGCVDDTSGTIKIWPLPKADFTRKEVCVGDTTLFFDKSLKSDPTDNLKNWIWDFGDNSAMSSDRNPEHVYLSSGIYPVQLIVGTNKGCVGDTTINIMVHPAPKANFIANPICKGKPISFQDLSTPSNIIIDWKWSFGDITNNISNQQNPTHIYDSIKVYNPQLIVTSQYGCSDSIIIPVNIPPLPEVYFDDKAQGCAPLCVNFADHSYSSVDPIAKWNWTFGEGNTSTIQNPPHCYPDPGKYSVSLTVETINGCKQSLMWKDMINVYSIPKADFEANPYETGENSPLIQFFDKSLGAHFWRWTFGDNEGAIEENTSHLYKKSGTYTVWLYIKNEYGCVDSIAKKILINPEWSFYIPNAFTPGSSIYANDLFYGKGVGIKKYSIWIFDRWGNEVWACEQSGDNAEWDTKPKEGMPSACKWDGKIQAGGPDMSGNSHVLAEQDVYVWKVELFDIFDVRHAYMGIVTLVR